jgi:hypothetical protein
MLSFSSLRSHPKVTLPSVDNGWLINSSIIKDPPRSITTRRIDKVGQTQMIEEMIEDNGSRICGTIMKFPRGVNPASEYTEPIENNVKSPNYNSTIRDNSNNPLQLRTDPGYAFQSQFGRGSGGYLARRLMMYGGAFRPPIMTQEQLLPLSRQPRLRTSCVTHPEKINYRSTCGQTNLDYSKHIKEYALQPNCEPTIKRVIEKSGQHCGEGIEGFIQDKLLLKNVNAGVRTRDLTLQENFKCPTVTNIKPTTAYAHTTPCTENITRDSMLYVMEKPTSYIRDELLQGSVLPNARYMDKYGMDVDNTNVDKWILEYPRKGAGEAIVCAPRHSGLLPTTEIDAKFYLHDDPTKCRNVVTNPREHKQVLQQNQNAVNFVRDDVLNTFDVVGMPTLNNVVAYNILDHNTVDVDKYINYDALQYDTHAGHYGSNKLVKRLDDAADFGSVKIIDDHIHADASTQLTCVDKNVYMHSRDQMGKQRVIKQFSKNAGRYSNNIDDPQNYKRQVKLNPTLDMSHYSISNVGYKPRTADTYNEMPVTHQVNDGKFKDRIKSVYNDRR